MKYRKIFVRNKWYKHILVDFTVLWEYTCNKGIDYSIKAL